MVPAVRMLPVLLARCHGACGWLSYRLGLRRRAQRHYERVLSLCGDDFSAFVHLGRIAYDTGDYAGWRREFEHARRANPERFARLRHPFELFEPRLAGTGFGDAGDRATWRAIGPGHSNEPDSPVDPLDIAPDDGGAALLEALSSLDGAPAGSAPPQPVLDLHEVLHDDCCGDDERARLRALGPIRREEIESCDLDELANRFGG